jgi:hypothetical protein
MAYRFHCSTTGDVLMLEHAGDTVLGAMGIAPAAKGIIDPAAMPAALEAIETAIEREESTPDRSEAAAIGTDSPAEETDPVSLRRRAWPLIDMMRRAHAEGAAIVWGV